MYSKKNKRIATEGQIQNKKDMKNQQKMFMIAQQIANTSPMCALPPYQLYFVRMRQVRQ